VELSQRLVLLVRVLLLRRRDELTGGASFGLENGSWRCLLGFILTSPCYQLPRCIYFWPDP
jgi:hypothetical protein